MNITQINRDLASLRDELSDSLDEMDEVSKRCDNIKRQIVELENMKTVDSQVDLFEATHE